MSQSRMLAHNNNNNVGSERNSNGSDDDDSTPLSTLTKGDMKVMMNRMMKCMLQSEIKTMVRNNRDRMSKQQIGTGSRVGDLYVVESLYLSMATSQTTFSSFQLDFHNYIIFSQISP
ncbi:hypothetical protein CsSME_00006877 [Camellia sinensis var. sinensis]